jgi:hypothetical protein
MVIVKMKVNRQITAAHWVGMAVGVEDEYGNPFRVIKLRWNPNRMHKMTEYAKTRGFEDAIISKDPKTGGVKITYRTNGSIMWMRPMGIGFFMGEVAQTPKNMAKLASHYGDKLWTILDADIDVIVRKMYEERKKNQTKEMADYDMKRINRMHTATHEHKENNTSAPELPLDIEKMDVHEKNRLNQIKQVELDKRNEALNMKEAALNKKAADMVGDGVAPVTYTMDYLTAQKLFKLRKLCTEVKVKWENSDKKEDLIKRITEKQTGNAAAVQKQMDGVIGSELDS